MKKLACSVVLAALLGNAIPLADPTKPDYDYLVGVETLDKKIQRSFHRLESEQQPDSAQSILLALKQAYSTMTDADKEQKEILASDLELIVKYSEPISVLHHDIRDFKNNLKTKSDVAAADVLYNTAIWKRFFWSDWDAVPAPLLTASLQKQFAQYAHVFEQEWSKMTNDDWNQIPSPVKTAVFMIMIRQASQRYGLEKALNDKNAYKWYASIILSESFFEHNPFKKSDVGLAQLSPYARQKLAKKSDFRGFTKADFEKPHNSINAGAAWFKECLVDARYDRKIAISAYNAGILDAMRGTQRAKSYEATVSERYAKYMEDPKSLTWQKIYEQAEASFDALFKAVLKRT
jgi:hypothetical protein